MEPVTVGRGVAPDQREPVAALYAEAFAGKLRPALGGPERAVPLLAAQLDADRFLVAAAGDRVLGVLGFHERGTGAFAVGYRALAARYRGALLRLALLAPLERRPAPGELLLDGVCVHRDARGRGIGTLLLDAAADLARARGDHAVRLSVVDSNPRARALYERLGFVAGRTERLGVLGHLYGVRAATTMVRAVAPAPGSQDPGATPGRTGGHA
jgi:ribosomal protein S18 acetylase RimI-like enzyme